MIYLDSCALVKLIHVETETAALAGYLDGEEDLVTCDLALTEVRRVIRRMNYDSQRRVVNQPVLDKELQAATELLDRVGRMIVDEATFLAAGVSVVDPLLGSLDSIHLVVAQELGATLASFVTYDRALGKAVTQAGIAWACPQ